MSRATYTHKFVKSFPDQLEEGTLYVSVEFGTAAHLCFCGCRGEVYTRFSPRDWSMRFDGETVSFEPSIGNWSFSCQSHYILAKGRVHWAERWSRERIELGRASDRERKERYFAAGTDRTKIEYKSKDAGKVNLVQRFVRWLKGN